MKRSKGSITISTTVGQELHKRAVELNLSWAEALRIGLTYQISKISDGYEYKNPIQLERKIEQLSLQLNEISQEKNRLLDEVSRQRFQQ
jgi:hypothetical protein